MFNVTLIFAPAHTAARKPLTAPINNVYLDVSPSRDLWYALMREIFLNKTLYARFSNRGIIWWSTLISDFHKNVFGMEKDATRFRQDYGGIRFRFWFCCIFSLKDIGYASSNYKRNVFNKLVLNDIRKL